MTSPTVVVHRDQESLADAAAARLVVALVDAQSARGVAHVSLTGGSRSHRHVDHGGFPRGSDRLVTSARVVGGRALSPGRRPRPQRHPERRRRPRRTLGLELPCTACPAPTRAPRPRRVPRRMPLPSGEHGQAASSTSWSSGRPRRPRGVPLPAPPAAATADAIAVAVHDSPKPPPDRVSLTRECLERSREVWFLVSGADKADAGSPLASRSAVRDDAGRPSLGGAPSGSSTPTPRPTWSADAPMGFLDRIRGRGDDDARGPNTAADDSPLAPDGALGASPMSASSPWRRSGYARSPSMSRRGSTRSARPVPAGIEPGDLATVAAAYDRALDRHEGEDASAVIDMLGTAMGDHLVTVGGYRWVVCIDPFGTDLAVEPAAPWRAGRDAHARRGALDGPGSGTGFQGDRTPRAHRPQLSVATSPTYWMRPRSLRLCRASSRMASPSSSVRRSLT